MWTKKLKPLKLLWGGSSKFLAFNRRNMPNSALINGGDELVVTRVDRLARSVFDLQDIVKTLDEKGVTLSATEQPISTKDATSKCFLDMLSVFAEFETNLRKERQMEGIAY